MCVWISLGVAPQTMEEWMFLIQLCQQRNSTSPSADISLLPPDPTTRASAPNTINGTSADNCVENTDSKGNDAGNHGPVELINESMDWSSQINVEKLVLCLARIVGPDQALAALQERGLRTELNTHATLVCELLRVAERRQR